MAATGSLATCHRVFWISEVEIWLSKGIRMKWVIFNTSLKVPEKGILGRMLMMKSLVWWTDRACSGQSTLVVDPSVVRESSSCVAFTCVPSAPRSIG